MKCRFLFTLIFIFPAYANIYSAYESFNNVVSIGVGTSSVSLSNSKSNRALSSITLYQLEVERLFKNNIWIDLNNSVVVSNLTTQVNGLGSNYNSFKSPFTQNPNLGGINLNIGYVLLVQDFLITPFINLGRNSNLSTSTVYFNNNKNITHDFYYTLGTGFKFDFIINQYFMLYLKPFINYNFDQSGPLDGVMPQNNLNYNIVLGTKFNLYKNLQIGLNSYYSYYQILSDLPLDKNTGYSIYSIVNNSSYGVNINFGLVY